MTRNVFFMSLTKFKTCDFVSQKVFDLSVKRYFHLYLCPFMVYIIKRIIKKSGCMPCDSWKVSFAEKVMSVSDVRCDFREERRNNPMRRHFFLSSQPKT